MKRGTNVSLKGSKNARKSWGVSPVAVFSHLLVAVSFFHLGLLAGRDGSQSRTSLQPQSAASNLDMCSCSSQMKDSSEDNRPIFPDSLNRTFAGAARVSRDEFAKFHDVGVPLLHSRPGVEEVLMLYTSESSLPDGYPGHMASSSKNGIPSFSSHEATQNCHVLKVIFMNPDVQQHCFALMSQWESYRVHKFMRIPENYSTKNWRNPSVLSSNNSLRLVGAMQKGNGVELIAPTRYQRKKNYKLMVDYLSKLEDTLTRLKPIAEKAAGKGNVIVVMVCNWGQSSLLFNFVCSARTRGIDLSPVLLFATDEQTGNLGRSLGLNVFDVQAAFGTMPTEAADGYGDAAFASMMMAKVYSVHLVNLLKYDLLYQDVDVVWYRDPLEFFRSIDSGDRGSLTSFDMYFQDDGARTTRFSPYYANSGFYFVRHNSRTEYFFSCMIRMGDIILADKSHQYVLIALLNQHASSQGLRVKVFGVDSTHGRQFPGGFHFHERSGVMKRIMNGTKVPYEFHMSWTSNKDVKRQFFQQMGSWFVEPTCENTDILPFSSTIVERCCVVEPTPICHFRDKPSKIPCHDSPAMDQERPSFW